MEETATPVRPSAAPVGGPQAADFILHLSPLESSEETAPSEVPPNCPEPTTYQKFVHGGWLAMRDRIYESLARTGQSKSRCAAFALCSAAPMLLYQGKAESEATAWRIAASRCHDRLCTTCATAKAWDIRLALYDQLAGKAHKFVTLTLRTGPEEPLSTCIDRLYKGFRALRASPLWEAKVRGGAAFLEITRGSTGKRKNRALCGGAAPPGDPPTPPAGHWHAHLHLILDADYIPQKELSYAWKNATRDSYIVDIQQVGGHAAANYVTKYVTKALSGPVLSHTDLLDEFVSAIKGRRLCLTFGDWYGKDKLSALADDTLTPDGLNTSGWSTSCDLATATRLAALGDATYAAAIASTDFGRWLTKKTAAP